MLLTSFQQDIRSQLQEDLGVANVMAVPSIEKVVVNMGIGSLQDDKRAVEEATEVLTLVTGQKPMIRRARQSIAGFSLREGSVVGLKVTLRGERAWSFVERLITVALPRSRDFRGIKRSSVDHDGNLTIGIAEHIIFPAVADKETTRLYGMEATIVPTQRDRDAAMALYKAIGVPLQEPA